MGKRMGRLEVDVEKEEEEEVVEVEAEAEMEVEVVKEDKLRVKLIVERRSQVTRRDFRSFFFLCKET